ncbi:MAG TPA: hypothetical protein PKW95_06525 [bacterium]|nr:hypothetical protein [bacterium]
MRLRTFSTAQRPLGPRLRALLALPDFAGEIIAHGPLDLVATDDPLMALDLRRDFIGKLPVWLDLDASRPEKEILPTSRRGRQALRQAELLTVSTRGLLAEARRCNANALWLPDPLAPPAAKAVDELPLVPPAVGFVGPREPALRWEVFAELAQRERRLQLYVGGDAADEPFLREAERRLPNLHLRPGDDETLWTRLHAALLPYRLDALPVHALPPALIRACQAGKPVLCAPLLEAGRLDATLSFADDAAGYARHLQSDLLNKTPTRAAGEILRAAVAHHHPESVAAILNEALSRVGR